MEQGFEQTKLTMTEDALGHCEHCLKFNMFDRARDWFYRAMTNAESAGDKAIRIKARKLYMDFYANCEDKNVLDNS